MPTTQLELRLASRMSRLGTETAFEVLNVRAPWKNRARQIVHLEIGEPDFDTPANIVEAAVNALHQGWTHYGPSAGLPDLRQAIADDVGRSRGVQGEAAKKWSWFRAASPSSSSPSWR